MDVIASAKTITGKPLLTKGDVLKYISENNSQISSKKIPAPASPSLPTASTSPATPTTTSEPSLPLRAGRSYEDKPVSMIRKVIASRLQDSKYSIPHYYVANECDVTKLLQFRKDMVQSSGIKVSVNDFVIRAVALALQDVPDINAFWNGSSSERQSTVDVSVAVATESGLITPIVRDANMKQVQEIGSDVRELAGLARQGKLSPEQYQGGSFTISNLGMFGMDEFTSIINPPQACILAVSKSEPKVGVVKDATGRKVPHINAKMTVQLSSDRRVVDDALAGQFMQVLGGYLSEPQMLI
jgi:pyruvate dehydrogenase complex dihydrolipoamide acetyltransferase long form